jgi:hypothetical protein
MMQTQGFAGDPWISFTIKGEHAIPKILQNRLQYEKKNTCKFIDLQGLRECIS